MYCKKCGTENIDSSRFCKKCGAELTPAVTPVHFPYEESELIDEELYNKKLYNKKPGKIMKAVIIVMVLVVVAEGVALYWPRINARIKENKDISIGDSMHFGAYEQDGDTSNGKEAIEWVVLDIKDGKALLISKHILNHNRYNQTSNSVTWENCTLRTWLNDTFLNDAFSIEEQQKIATTYVSADENPRCITNPGNATYDRVFLLSIDEAEKYFNSNQDRKTLTTAYEKARMSNGCLWWLRSPGFTQYYAASVLLDGSVFYFGDYVYDRAGVRPALWINLDS